MRIDAPEEPDWRVSWRWILRSAGRRLNSSQTKCMRRSIAVAVLVFGLLFIIACGAGGSGNENSAPPASSNTPTTTETNASPPPNVVIVSAAPMEIPAGGSAEAQVTAKIADGFHVNANPPTFSYLIPTKLTLDQGASLTASNPVYPASVTRNFAFAEKPLAVYEGEAVIKVKLRAAPNATRGEHILNGKLVVQACNDLACFPPRTLPVSIPVVIN